MNFSTFSRTSVEFAQSDYTYTSSAGTYRARVVVRATDKHVLALLYAAKESEYSETEWQMLIRNIQIEAELL